MDTRYGRVKWGPSGKRIQTSQAYWRQPLRWEKEAKRTEKRYRVFCGSLCDIFENKPDQPEMDEWRFRLLHLINLTPNLDWLLLTKRPELVLPLLETAGTPDGERWEGILPDNVWIGTSVEDQETANKRIPHLLEIPAAIRFLSCEPLLGPIDLTFIDDGEVMIDPEGYQQLNVLKGYSYDAGTGEYGGPFPHIDWIIVGGESGPEARPMHPYWAQIIRDQCLVYDIPFFFKQRGAWTWDIELPGVDDIKMTPSGHILKTVEDAKRYPGYLRFSKVGKKKAGRELDGREWNRFPKIEY